jgi:hypothetical protein
VVGGGGEGGSDAESEAQTVRSPSPSSCGIIQYIEEYLFTTMRRRKSILRYNKYKKKSSG